MTDTNELVARNVRRYRQERGMSLGELARASGLSKQTLSKVEQGQGNPTVETLSLLGAALEIPPRRLLTEWGTPVFVQRRDDATWSDDHGWQERILDEVYGSGYVRTGLMRLERGVEADPVPGYPAGTLQHLYVITGQLQTGPLTDPVTLSAGDFTRFPADVPHRYRCLSERAVVHAVTTLPQLRQLRPVGTRG